MKLSVVVPTFRRTESLGRCLDGIQVQLRPADEVLVIVQEGDRESIEFLGSWDWPVLKVLRRAVGGQVNQLNVGLEEADGEIIAITDDDAVPRPDWLMRIEQHFLANADLGGVGGRDYVQEDGVVLCGDARVVGIVQSFGRVVGNHHIGGRMRANIDILKGANMAYRKSAIGEARFDTDLRGRGAQTCNDMAFSLGIQRRGWRLLFDPKVAVDHFPAKRYDLDQRGAPSLQAIEDSSFNFYVALRRHMRRGARREMALVWAWAIGVEKSPGKIRGLLSRLKGDETGVAMRAAAARAWTSAKQICEVKS